MNLLIQPDDGVGPLVKAIARAKRSVEIVIFRFDQKEIERALSNAAGRGVEVYALIAHTNRAGEENLRKLELRLLAAGITVARTAQDLTRYHNKLMIVDRREVYILAFNLTTLDTVHSRSFGIVTRQASVVREAARLFEADCKRQQYQPASDSLVVSPANARKLLHAFIAGAKKELVIYDPKVSDLEMIRLLEKRAAAGVEIRIIGRLTRKTPGIAVCKLEQMRLHTRTMVRDGRAAFVGSQSLRALELDARREVGVIFRDPKAVARIYRTFAADWALAEGPAEDKKMRAPAAKAARKVAKLLARELPHVTPVLNGAVKEIVGGEKGVQLDPAAVTEALKGAVKSAVTEVVADLVDDAVEANGGRSR